MANIKGQELSNGNKVFPNPNVVGIDTSNLLASGDVYSLDTPTIYIATQDCFCVLKLNNTNYYGVIKLDGITVSVGNNDGYCIAKKGQTISFTSNSAVYHIYGLKY